MGDDLVKVAVRIRPLVQSETERGCQNCLHVIPGEEQIQIPSADKAFTFNYVFPPDCTQEEFYNTGIKHMIKNIFEGYNVTILAYGQTGSGKTYSMGTNYEENNEKNGVIPRAVNDIFEHIKNSPEFEYKVSVAFMELYKEQLFDLLTKKSRCDSLVDIREDTKGIKFVNLSEVKVSNTQETLKYLSDGSQNRATGSTAMNISSSRSHAIFTITVYQQKQGEPDSGKFAKFHLVDLAGSERSKKTQATGERFKEGININKGLLALGNVISSLGENGNSSYVGYRDSKLTRLLQDSLGGNSVTLMIACVSPANYNMDETISTLRYADRAKKIKNKPIVNQDPRIVEIENLKRTIQELKSALHNANIDFCPAEHSELLTENKSLQRKIRVLTDKLNVNLLKIVHLHERADLTEHSMEQINSGVAKILEDCENLLEDFSGEPFDKDYCKAKLEAICISITGLQKDQKKAVDELLTQELSLDSFTNHSTASSTNLPLVEFNVVDQSLNNETFSLDEKNEEHTLKQGLRVDEVEFINKQIANKEELVSNLIKNSPQIAVYHKELEEMEKEIAVLQKEKDELLQALRNAEANAASSKLSESRRRKVQELEKKISELSGKCLKQNKIIKNKEKSDLQIKALINEITGLKQTKVRLIRDARSEADKFTKWKRTKEQELYRLRNQDKKHLNELTKLKVQYGKQTNVMKRKIEEYQAANKRLKDALDLQKKASARREKAFKDREDVKSWIYQEVEVILSSVDAECAVEKLKQDKEIFEGRLAELQQDEHGDEKEMSEIKDILETRAKQIEELEKHIKEFNQENKSKARWNMVSTMVDAKEALRTLFEIAAANGKKYSLLKSEYNDLMEKSEKCREQKETPQQDVKLEPKTETLETSEELHKKIKSLEAELLSYKERCEEQQKILANKDLNVIDKKPKPKMKPKLIEESFSESFGLTDDSIMDEDDEENDPDWKKTPLFNRIKVMERHSKRSQNESKLATKRSSNGEIKCSCKTQCSTRLCTCRKNGVACENCNCNASSCQNKDKSIIRQTLYFENKNDSSSDESSIKKAKIQEEA